MNKLYFLPESDILKIRNAYNDLNSLLQTQTAILGKIKKFKIKKLGVNVRKSTGKGHQKVIFAINKVSDKNNQILYIDLKTAKLEKKTRKTLIKIMLRKKHIFFAFNDVDLYSRRNLSFLEKYINQIHPEALILSSVCQGKGIDVGCGHRKTHPDSIGIDWIEKGEKGNTGNVRGKISEADICAKGDNLKMFKNNCLDYVVSRHNLEHYRNSRRTLREWVRVLKIGGKIGIIVPNGENPDTNEETHYSYFNLETFRDIIIKTDSLKIIKIAECVPNWSFYCIARKTN